MVCKQAGTKKAGRQENFFTYLLFISLRPTCFFKMFPIRVKTAISAANFSASSEHTLSKHRFLFYDLAAGVGEIKANLTSTVMFV